MALSNRKRSVLRVGILAGATVSVWFGSQRIVAWHSSPRAVTVISVESQFRAGDGALLAKTERRQAVRSDGSRVEPRIVTAPDGKAYEQRIILDVPGAKRIVVEGITQTVSTTRLSDSELAALQFAGGVCGEPGGLPGESVLGYRTVRREVRSPLLTVVSLSAPDAGCTVLRETVFQQAPDGTQRIVIQRQAASVEFGEPDAALFQIPDWPEAPPSQVFERYRQKFNLANTDELRKGNENQDRAYWSLQRRRP